MTARRASLPTPSQAMETAASDGPGEDLSLRLESWPRRLGHLPTGLPQDLGNRSADSTISTAAWKTRSPLRADAFPTVPTASAVTARGETKKSGPEILQPRGGEF